MKVDEAKYRLLEMFETVKATDSDIWFHLPFLNHLGGMCATITEFGTGRLRSTTALAASMPSKMRTYDVGVPAGIEDFVATARNAGIDFEFINKSVLDVSIEPTDLLFIDTLHTEDQVFQELQLHAHLSRRYLIFHDTETFGLHGEDGIGRGIWYGIRKYMRAHPEWLPMQHFPPNNGLTVFIRADSGPSST